MRPKSLKIRIVLTSCALTAVVVAVVVWVVAANVSRQGGAVLVGSADYYPGILAVALLVAAVVAWLSVERFLVPLQRFTEHVARQKVESLQPYNAHDTGSPEVALLAASFNELLERIGAESAAVEQQFHFLQILLETIPNPIFYKDAEFRYLGCNSAFESYIGLSKDELIGRTVYDISPAELAAVYDRADRELLATQGVQIYEAQVRYADGSRHDVIFYKTVFRHPDGSLGGILGVVVDITARKEAEREVTEGREALREALVAVEGARQHLDNIVHSVADPLVVLAADGSVAILNPLAEQLFGLDGAEIVGRSLKELHIDAQLCAVMLDCQCDLFLSGESSHTEVTISGAGRQRVIQVRPSLMLSPGGRCNGTIFILRDVTRERELDRMKTEFISTAAHELRTPLTAIMGFAELLVEEEHHAYFSDEQRREFLQIIYERCEALGRVVDDLLDISRIEAGARILLERSRHNLHEVLVKVLRPFIFQATSHNFVIDPSLESLPPIDIDGNKMIQVFENLVSNAVKYSPGGGAVRLRGERDGAMVRIVVEDEGIGMTPEQVTRVFDKFYRADASNTAIGGLGLGMSIVRAIVEEHGGAVRVESALGAGTTVTVELPVTTDVTGVTPSAVAS